MLECMLELRADKHYRIGLKNKHRYSMYVVSSSGAQSSHDRDRLHVLPVHMAVEAIVSSIKSELGLYCVHYSFIQGLLKGLELY